MDDHLLPSLSGFAVNCLNHWIIPKRGSAWRDESEVERISWTTMSLNLLNCDCIIIDWLTSSWNNRATELAKLTAKSLFKKKPNPTKRNETKRNETKQNKTKRCRPETEWNWSGCFSSEMAPSISSLAYFHSWRESASRPVDSSSFSLQFSNSENWSHPITWPVGRWLPVSFK